jgi:hypothetical protein
MKRHFRAAVALLASSMLVLGVSALLSEGVAMLTATQAGALTTITVGNSNDSGAGSLRQAFIDSSSGGTDAGSDVEIAIPASVGTITLTTGELHYDGGTGGGHNLTLNGGGNTIQQTAGRVINSTTTGSITVEGLTITGGNVGGPLGGGISAAGAVSVVDSTITGNTVGVEGGGIGTTGSVTLTNSTVAGNHSGDPGGGIQASSATIVNSTITNNTSAVSGGGVSATSVSLAYATVVANTGSGGGVNIAAAVGAGTTITSFGSVIALPNGATNCYGVTTSLGFNWDDDGSCGFGSGLGDHSNAGNPMLGALASNGGPTQTLLPQSESPLIDKIPLSHCGDGNSIAGTSVTTDQRHLPRPSPTGGACDIGAVEVQVTLSAPTPAPAVVLQPRFTG